MACPGLRTYLFGPLLLLVGITQGCNEWGKPDQILESACTPTSYALSPTPVTFAFVGSRKMSEDLLQLCKKPKVRTADLLRGTRGKQASLDRRPEFMVSALIVNSHHIAERRERDQRVILSWCIEVSRFGNHFVTINPNKHQWTIQLRWLLVVAQKRAIDDFLERCPTWRSTAGLIKPHHILCQGVQFMNRGSRAEQENRRTGDGGPAHTTLVSALAYIGPRDFSFLVSCRFRSMIVIMVPGIHVGCRSSWLRASYQKPGLTTLSRPTEHVLRTYLPTAFQNSARKSAYIALGGGKPPWIPPTRRNPDTPRMPARLACIDVQAWQASRCS